MSEDWSSHCRGLFQRSANSPHQNHKRPLSLLE